MNREYHRWHSSRLGRDMELLAFGHNGLPVLVFPTSHGRFFEYEDRGMVAALAPTIEAGNIRLYCVDSVNEESWYCGWAHPHGRVQRHLQYEQYLLHEVVPLIQQQARSAQIRIATTGCSLGGFQAALLAFRHPWLVARMISLSGKFENSTFLDGYSDGDAYLTNPLAFLPGLDDPRFLDPLRAMDIVLVTGATDPHIHEDRLLSRILWDKGIANTLDVWDGWSHDWPYWQQMITKHL